jgi:hypothetical protein
MVNTTSFYTKYKIIKIYFLLVTEHETKDTTDAARSASYLDLYLDIDSEG